MCRVDNNRKAWGVGKELDRSKTGKLVLKALMFKGPKQEYKWRPAPLLPLCLKAISKPTNC